MKYHNKIIFISLLYLIPSLVMWGQNVNEKSIKLDMDIISESRIILHSVTNESGVDVRITVRDGKKTMAEKDLSKDQTLSLEVECTVVQAYPIGVSSGSGGTIWAPRYTKAAWAQMQADSPSVKLEEKHEEKVKNKEKPSEQISEPDDRKPAAVQKKTVGKEVVIRQFGKEVEADRYYSRNDIDEYVSVIEKHVDFLNVSGGDRDSYIKSFGLGEMLKNDGKHLQSMREDIPDYVVRFMSRYNGYEMEGRKECEEAFVSLLSERIAEREAALGLLSDALASTENVMSHAFDWKDPKTMAAAGGILAVLLISVIMVIRKRRRKPVASAGTEDISVAPTIVVRSKTESILKKQNIDDVSGNQDYMRIDASDFSSDSFVRNIYLKNTCVKDIYNMYSEDLRNPDNPKEDGCMVVGRWIFDEAANCYDVTLERIVRPGDDAVFREYELNFGGKIKLKVAETLRKFRKDTNLQYDLTCWVHSHPGLGVFFSNSDNNVQMQLKHPMHPGFLVAIVVDILTPQQEVGIFTFKKDMSVNSKNDIKKMYSLEEWHKWAIESERLSFRVDDCLDVLSGAEKRFEHCSGIHLNNSAIIDMCSVVTDGDSGLIGWVHGYESKGRGRKELIVKAVTRSENNLDNEMLGCLVSGIHCSIPTIRRIVSGYEDKLQFVMFYASSDDVLTCIPVANGQLCTDHTYYSEEILENIKIWTRRKR